MTSSDTLFQGQGMCEVQTARHTAALVAANDQRNESRYPIDEMPRIQSVGIIGAGNMGRLVAASAVEQGIAVAITDRDTNVLDDVKRVIRDSEGCEGAKRQEREALVTTTSDLTRIGACDLVVETIVENIADKRNLYAQLETHCSSETIIVSNTSTLPITELAVGLRDPQRFCGMHYFPPLGDRQIIEIIPGDKTSKSITSRLVRFSQRLGRYPIVVPDGRGFLVNRVLMAYMSAGIRLLAEGVDIDTIESAALSFGMPVGPIRCYDEVGLDVALHCGWSLSADSETLVARSPTIVRMIKKKQLGRKTGRGFFIYDAMNDGESVGALNPMALEIIASLVERSSKLTGAEIESTLILPMVIEATRLLEMKRAASPQQLDLAIMCGLGFPASKGGPLYWSDHVGTRSITNALDSLTHLGPHLRPTDLMLDAAAHGRRFYASCNNGNRDVESTLLAETRESL